MKRFETPEEREAFLRRRLWVKDLDEAARRSNWNASHFIFGDEEPPIGKRPTFVQVPPSEISIQEGDPLTLRCTVDGDPKPVGMIN